MYRLPKPATLRSNNLPSNLFLGTLPESQLAGLTYYKVLSGTGKADYRRGLDPAGGDAAWNEMSQRAAGEALDSIVEQMSDASIVLVANPSISVTANTHPRYGPSHSGIVTAELQFIAYSRANLHPST